jgi:hypothetical protein
LAYQEFSLYVDSVSYGLVAQWAATHAYTVGQIVRQLAAPAANSERCFICIVAGTSLSTEPTWVLTRGAKTTEAAGPTWMECTGLPALCADNTSTNAWHASAGAIALGWIIKNVVNDHYFICTTAGTGGTGTEPTWSTTTGATTTDNTVTWTCIGATSSFTTKFGAAHARLTTPLNGAANWLLNAGMNVYVGDDHSEANTGTSYNAVSICLILCVDHTASLPPGTGNLKTTATINVTGVLTFLSNTSGSQGYVYGVVFTSTSTFTIAGGAQTRNRLEHCTFTIAGAAGTFNFGATSGGQNLELKDCSFGITSWSSANQGFILDAGTIKIENGVFTATVSTTALALIASNSSSASAAVFEGCDFSGIASTQYLLGTVAGTSVPSGFITFKDCVISAGTIIYAGATHLPAFDNVTIDLNRTDGGGTAYRNERYRLEGQLTTATGIVRTGGASDGATPVSHQIATNANTNNVQRIFNSVPFAIWNAVIGSNRNVTVYGIVNDSRVPNNDEVWFDVEYLGSASSPKGSYARGGKANVLAAGSALTASTSAWDSAATARANTTAYTVGQVIKTASNAGRVFFCTGAGTSAGSEPAGTIYPTWNPADKGTTNTILSNGNLTYGAGSSNTTNDGCRSTQGITAGKFYFELTSAGSTTLTMLGVGLLSSVFGNILSGVGGSFAVYIANGHIWDNATDTTISIGAASPGTVYCFAIDLINMRGWIRNGAGNWNNSGTANPATNAGGQDISWMGSAAVYALVASNVNANPIVTANFGATSFAQAVPSGFAAISTPGYNVAVDGQTVIDGTATFRAGCRFSQTLTLSAPQPQQAGYLYAYPKLGRPSMTYYLDPLPVLS